jgi:hypothetical protein
LVFLWSTGYSCQVLMKLQHSRQILKEYPNIKFHENPSSGSRIVPCRRKGLTKLIVAFRNAANKPNKNLNHTATFHILKAGGLWMVFYQQAHSSYWPPSNSFRSNFLAISRQTYLFIVKTVTATCFGSHHLTTFLLMSIHSTGQPARDPEYVMYVYPSVRTYQSASHWRRYFPRIWYSDLPRKSV